MPTSNFLGVGTLEVTSLANYVEARQFQPVESGVILSATVLVSGGWILNNDLFVQVGIETGGDGQEFTNTILAQGYIQPGNAISWVGEIPLTTGDWLFLAVRWSGTRTVRCNFRTVSEVNIE